MQSPATAKPTRNLSPTLVCIIIEQAGYFNGKTYISPDIDGHNVTNGWKMFNKKGRRLGTFDENLNFIKD